jgi:hypothetical protein
MRIKVQVVIEPDDEGAGSVHEVAELERGALQAETLGLGLEEAKDLLAQVQEMVAEQSAAAWPSTSPARTVGGLVDTRTPARSRCKRCSAFSA